MKKLYGLFFLIIFEAILAVRLWHPLAQAQDPSPQTDQPEVVQTQEISGTLLRIEDQTLSIETDTGIQQVTISNPQSMNISRNGFEASLNDIKPNDSVTVIQTTQGEVLSVESTAGEVGDWSKVVIPLLILGVLAAAIIFMMTRKAKQPHIKTESGQV